MTADFISSDASIPSSSTTTYQSPFGFTVLVSVVVLFLICSFIFFFQHCFSIHHHEQTAATPVHPRVRSGSSMAAQPPPGLDEAAVAALPVVRCTGGGGGEGCAVCLVEYVDKERVKVIPRCGHRFHLECIDTWLMRRGSCPVCRCSEMWGTWSGEVCAGVFGFGDRNGGELRRSRSCDSHRSEVEEGGRGSEMLLRRTCSV